MGRSKKKYSSSKQEGEGSVREAQPTPRKRGRPKKIAEQIVAYQETEEEEDEKQKKPSEQESSSSKGKNKREEEEEEEAPKIMSPKIGKREGMRRRKGEPRRAAE